MIGFFLYPLTTARDRARKDSLTDLYGFRLVPVQPNVSSGSGPTSMANKDVNQNTCKFIFISCCNMLSRNFDKQTCKIFKLELLGYANIVIAMYTMAMYSCIPPNN